MKKYFVLSLLVFLLALTALVQTGFCKDDAQTTIKFFYNCVQKGDIEGLSTIVPKEVFDKMTQGKDLAEDTTDFEVTIWVTKKINEGKFKFEVSDLKLTEEKNSGSVAVINAKYKAVTELVEENDKETTEGDDTFTLKKIEGIWIIVDMIDNISAK